MKKLLLLITLGSLIFSGASYAQDAETPNREGAVKSDGGFHIPRALRSNEDIKAAAEAYNTSRTEFRASFSEIRQRLAAASEEEKVAIKGELRELMSANGKAQREFRRNVRQNVRELREERTDSTTEG